MYFTDLSPYTYSTHVPLSGVLNVGWLDRSMPFSKGTVPSGFLDRLKDWFRVSRVNQMRGIHDCNFCRARQWPLLPLQEHPSLTIDGKSMFLGNWEIWIPGSSGTVFASPALIIHYIDAHEYHPPEEFITAAMNDCTIPNWNGQAEFAKRTAELR